MKKVLLCVVAAFAFAVPAAALADNGGDQTANPSNSAAASNSGSNQSSQSAVIGQWSSAYSQVNFSQVGGAGSNTSQNDPNASGANSSTAGDAGDSHGFFSAGGDSTSGANGNSAGQGAAGNGGNGGDAGGSAIAISDPTSASNDATVTQLTSQKIVVLAPAIQEASADYNNVLALLFGHGRG